MQKLSLDIETYSSADLAKSGVYRYAEADDFRVLLLAYSVDGAPVEIVDLETEPLPEFLAEAILSDAVEKHAYNAAFERVCLSRHLGHWLDPASWHCTMVAAARMGFPLGLDLCAKALKLPIEKMKEGRQLIRLFSTPQRDGQRAAPADHLEKWETFKEYCCRDVEVEMAISEKVSRMPVPDWERALYVADQRINDRGVGIDRAFVENAARFDADYKAQLQEEARRLTGLDNPNSPTQLKEWLHRVTGINFPSVSKTALSDRAHILEANPKTRRWVRIRAEQGKTSCAKYAAMLASVCSDGRIRGLLQFYGANRTGRWAGRLVQMQNLPQNHLADLDGARELVKAGDLDEFDLEMPNTLQTLSQLIRTSFVAPARHTLHVCDFSAIEARVLAWLAGEKWVLDVFRDGGDIYCSAASRMFGIPVEKHGQNSHLRQKGKIATLALGYGGGVAALDAMGAGRMGLSSEEQREIVTRWRTANRNITRFWRVLENAAFEALSNDGQAVTIHRGLAIQKRWGCLIITLPSGRALSYPRARIAQTGGGWSGSERTIEFEGVTQTTNAWDIQRTYGGKLTENVVQAIARDLLAHVILQSEAEHLRTIFHVHDETVTEAPEGQTLDQIERIFSTSPTWCTDLPLAGAGYITPYYKKD